MTTRPAATVLMPVLDTHQFISDAIRSVLEQTFADFELLLVASSEAAGEIGVADATESRIRLLSRDTRGLADALNIGLAEATGDFVARMHPDGLCLPERLARQVALFIRDPALAIVVSAWGWVDENGTITSAERFPRNPTLPYVGAHSSLRRSRPRR
jgi:glycosyltransferase involved in cell wall biosynthesis